MKKLGVFLFLICFIQAFLSAGANIYLYVDGDEADYVIADMGEVITVRVYVEFTGSTVCRGVGLHIDFDETYMRVLDQLPPVDQPTTDNTIFHPFQKGTFFSNVMHYYNGIYNDQENPDNPDLGKLVYERQIQHTAPDHNGWGYLCKFQLLAQQPVTNSLIKVNYNYNYPTHYFYDQEMNVAPFDNTNEANFYLTINSAPVVLPNPVETNISMEDSQLSLSWMKDPLADGYRIYTDTSPYFDVNGADLLHTITSNNNDIVDYLITTPGMVGDVDVNHYFCVVGYNQHGQSNVDSYVGEMDFDIKIKDDDTDINAISIPFENYLYNDTESLCNEITVAETVSKWIEETQKYSTYLKAPNINSFSLTLGEFYFIGAEDSMIWTAYGKVPKHGSFSFNLVNNIEPGVTDINAISLPLFVSGINYAEDFNNGSNGIPFVETVIQWDAAQQEFSTHIIELPINNFEVKPGYPYMVGVGQDANGMEWPVFE